ncbi:hypothetical protein DCS_00976 [Drechmeria coniospora]|uniref:Uncharacterized protein n=1 Tax=Drechmeria coniospora TaxID=98403 RepID=A0A151GS56_DRECN|nr:hypothetical protein DCS_00976 [Drechmeria coniospora]KYK59842.1 hypothetical protein DCS_00976 [Drechmeria coniospora]
MLRSVRVTAEVDVSVPTFADHLLAYPRRRPLTRYGEGAETMGEGNPIHPLSAIGLDGMGVEEEEEEEEEGFELQSNYDPLRPFQARYRDQGIRKADMRQCDGSADGCRVVFGHEQELSCFVSARLVVKQVPSQGVRQGASPAPDQRRTVRAGGGARKVMDRGAVACRGM